jgi:cyclic pyranopterin phosphate synthase
MVDVSAKAVTAREATARGEVWISAEALAVLRDGRVPKGDALAVARLAGIQAAKRTPDLVPLAHPVAVHGVEVSVELPAESDGWAGAPGSASAPDVQGEAGEVDDPIANRVLIEATVRTADRTGVEMEALTCVAVAGLAFIDMIKAVDRMARITNVRVIAKSGGRSGDWRAEP